MATEILRPRDCLIQRIRVPPATFSRHRCYTNSSNAYNNHHAPTPTDQRKRVPVRSEQPVSVLKRSCASSTILRRGRSLDSSSTVADVYAGSAFSVEAPSPSAVPLPSFPTKKLIDDSATRDLRRLLGLE